MDSSVIQVRGAPPDSRATPSLDSVVDLFLRRIAETPTAVAIRYKQGGNWHSMTFAEWHAQSREIAAGLLGLGVGRGDRVAILAATRMEWFLVDVAVVMAGAVSVPIYPSSTSEQSAYIISDSEARLVFVDSQEQAAKLKPNAVGAVVHFGSEAIAGPLGAQCQALEALRAHGRAHLLERPSCLDGIQEALSPADPFTIVYTSGTTASPKGVVLTHGNMLFECAALGTEIPMDGGDEQLLFLPLAHIFARILEWMAIACGSITSFAQNLTTLKQDLVEIEPTYMGAVPRVYEKLYAGILSKVGEGRPLPRKIFAWARRVGERVSRLRQRGQEPQGLLALEHRVAKRLVFDKLRKRLGLARMRHLISGGAPLSREIAEFFHSLDLLILEGYGLTETTAATHVNRIGRYRFGTVGPPIPGIEVRLDDDGEVLIRGGNVMREYWRRDAETREAIDGQGWFHTGDVGQIDDGFLRITDRKKDLIVTSGGKKVAPQVLETALKAQSPWISQVLVCGEGKPFLSALITLNEEALASWARGQHLAMSDGEPLSARPEVRRLVEAEVGKLNATLASYESIKKFQLLGSDFSQESGEMTPSLKLRRRVIVERYRDLIDAFYR